MNSIRCFLAIKLDIEVARALAECQRELKTQCDTLGIRVSWVPPPNLHVTIRFLGQVAEPMAQALKGMLEEVTKEMTPFQLDSAGLGAFPNASRPRVIWAGLTRGQNDIESLWHSVSKRLVSAGFAFDETPFKSHVTLGRVKSARTQDMSSLLGEREYAFGSTYVRNLYCYRSDLSSRGAEYHALWRLPLSREPRSEGADEMTARPENGASPPSDETTESPAGIAPAVEPNGEQTHDSDTG